NHDAERLDGFFKDRATTENEYPLLVVNQRFSPVVVYEPGSGQKITGELYLVDQATMDWMDALEGITLLNGYRKHCIAIVTATGEHYNAWIYTKSRDLIEEIHDGPLHDYQDHRHIIHPERNVLPKKTTT
ncbi:MAG: gamma-glutamylaminecyclotransferase, partial [Parasphingorhabdus sp.]